MMYVTLVLIIFSNTYMYLDVLFLSFFFVSSVVIPRILPCECTNIDSVDTFSCLWFHKLSQ